jgi:UDP-2,3-diacylglucosamine pyrophosphatase LpxH
MLDSKTHYRAVFISDLHLGAVGSKPVQVRRFLKSISCDYLYLVGDIIEGWVGHERKWSQQHTDALRAILSLAAEGSQVYYTPGNHDDLVRRINGSELGNIKIDHSFTHTTFEGKDFLVVHGDLFDKSVSKYRPLAKLGAYLSEWFAVMDRNVSKIRAKKGKHHLDTAAKLKTAFKKYLAKTIGYEQEVIDYARENGFDGVVCGHVHRPLVESFPDGFTYINTGDWVDHCTAFVEYSDGRMELLKLGEEVSIGEPTMLADDPKSTHARLS